MSDPKDTLVTYLQRGRDSLVWKLEGLSEYDVRRPMTPTGTSLLGIVKHCAWVEAEYFGDAFGRPFPEPAPWDGQDESVIDPHDDLYALPSESRQDILDLYASVQAWAAETIGSNDLNTEGHVKWWGDRNPVTLHWILVHCVAEVQHHAGHADILREMIDGATGYLPEHSNHPDDGYDWSAYLARVQAAADTFK